MSITKQAVIDALETLASTAGKSSSIENESIKNIQVFGNEVLIDVTISNPTLQAKKKIEAEIVGAIEKLGSDLDIKINVNAVVPPKAAPQIKGKEIPGIRNIIAIPI